MTHEQSLAAIEQVLVQLRPKVQMDGGDIELVTFEAGVVHVRMHGACVGCPASMYTLKLGVEAALKEVVPSVTSVVSVED